MSNSRLSLLFDNGEYTAIDPFLKSGDSATVDAGFGNVGGASAYAFSQHGALDKTQCQKLIKIYDLAQKTGCPVIGTYDADGVELNEGFEVLNAYGELLKAASRVSGVVPQLSVIAGSCLGISAVMANMADVVIALEGSDFYLTPGSDLSVENTAEAGVTDLVCASIEEAFAAVKHLLLLLPSNNLSPLLMLETEAPQSHQYGDIEGIADADTVINLKGSYADTLSTCLAAVGGMPVGILKFNGEALTVKSAYQAEWLVKLCDAFNLPVITVADAEGCSREQEAQLMTALTKLVSAYASATCPKISLITSALTGAAYVALAGKGANADITLAWDTALAAPMSVSSAVAFLWNDRLAAGENREALEKEFCETLGSAVTAASAGAVDDIIAPQQTRARLIEALHMLANKRETTLPRKHNVK